MLLIKNVANIFKQRYFQRRFSIFIKLQQNHKNEEPTDEDRIFEEFSQKCFSLSTDYNCFIIHPYVKWGVNKLHDTNPQRQLEEAIALIRTLYPWKVQDTIIVPLEGLGRKSMFGSGTLEKLKNRIRRDNTITAVFINIGTLKMVQIEELEREFRVPIMDRYRIIMQIFKLHATSPHAKLQVSLAEIPYIRANLKKFDSHFMATSDFDTRRFLLQKRETKLKQAIEKLRSQRQLLRKKRLDMDFPVIAVVGYTNAGKTSLIKTLTSDPNLQPRNQLFATLDVTLHGGILPSKLEVLFVDTVGFISDIPTGLIECFVATMEDALFADVILHVEDLSSEDYEYQKKEVLSTLKNLAEKSSVNNILDKIITVGNKCDLIQPKEISDSNYICVSAKEQTGIAILKDKLEEIILKATERSIVSFKLPNGGDETRWLYKNATVLSENEDQNDSQKLIVKTIITKPKLEQFRYHYLKNHNR